MKLKDTTMAKVRQKYKKIYIDRRWLFAALVMWILSFVIDIWPIIFITIFCVANAILLSIDRYVQAPIDIEFSTFSAVLITREYGLTWGIIVAIMTKVAAIFYNKNIRVDHFFMIGGYVLAALFASIFPGLNIILLGVVVTIMTNLYVIFVSKFITMLSNYEILMYGMSNVIFNIVLFIGFAEIFSALMI